MNLRSKIREGKRPFLISGPCSAESEEQMFTIVEGLKNNTSTELIRAGIWKPRTRPNSFEGMGEIALPWLIDAAKTFKLPTAVEIAN